MDGSGVTVLIRVANLPPIFGNLGLGNDTTDLFMPVHDFSKQIKHFNFLSWKLIIRRVNSPKGRKIRRWGWAKDDISTSIILKRVSGPHGKKIHVQRTGWMNKSSIMKELPQGAMIGPDAWSSLYHLRRLSGKKIWRRKGWMMEAFNINNYDRAPSRSSAWSRALFISSEEWLSHMAEKWGRAEDDWRVYYQ